MHTHIFLIDSMGSFELRSSSSVGDAIVEHGQVKSCVSMEGDCPSQQVGGGHGWAEPRPFGCGITCVAWMPFLTCSCNTLLCTQRIQPCKIHRHIWEVNREIISPSSKGSGSFGQLLSSLIAVSLWPTTAGAGICRIESRN